MSPELSRLLADVVNSPLFLERDLSFRDNFVERVSDVNTLNDLSDRDRRIVENAEASFERDVWEVL